MARVAVSERVLRWAVARSGRSEKTVADKFPLMDWLAGIKQPTLRQLEAFATYTRAPLGFFFLDEPPADDLVIPFFRTLDDEKPAEASPELVEVVHSLRRRQQWIREYLVRQGHDPLPFVGKTALTADPVHVASAMRNALELDEEWAQQFPTWEDALRYLRGAMDDAGVFVVVNSIVGNNTHRKLDETEFRGFVLVDEYAPFVFVNGSDARSAQMFTLAHELAHIFFGYSAAFDLHALHPADDEVERQCNRVAAEFLVPANRLANLWPSVQDEQHPFQSLARLFKVSSIVIARRLLDLGLITRTEFFSYYVHQQSLDKRRKGAREGGGDFYKNQGLRVGARFFTHVVNALHEGMITYTEAYRLTDLHGSAFRKYAEYVIGGVSSS